MSARKAGRAWIGDASLLVGPAAPYVPIRLPVRSFACPPVTLTLTKTGARFHPRPHARRYRPVPLKVVFGEPIEPRAGEDLESVHGRYCLALTRLAKQHDVPLRIVE